MPDINLPIAFAAGLISFCAPCIIPLVPAYVGYITGVSLNDLKKENYSIYAKKLVISTIFYILGFSLVFVLLGITVGGLGVLIRRNNLLVERIGGALILILGFDYLGLIHIPFGRGRDRFFLPAWTEHLGYLRATFVGMVFATAWSPCIGAVLGSILALTAVSETAKGGALLLFVYSLGLSLPFMIISLTIASAPKYLAFIRRYVEPLSKVSAVLLIILGILLLTDTYKYLNAAIFDIAFKLENLR